MSDFPETKTTQPLARRVHSMRTFTVLDTEADFISTRLLRDNTSDLTVRLHFGELDFNFRTRQSETAPSPRAHPRETEARRTEHAWRGQQPPPQNHAFDKPRIRKLSRLRTVCKIRLLTPPLPPQGRSRFQVPPRLCPCHDAPAIMLNKQHDSALNHIMNE